MHKQKLSHEVTQSAVRLNELVYCVTAASTMTMCLDSSHLAQKQVHPGLSTPPPHSQRQMKQNVYPGCKISIETLLILLMFLNIYAYRHKHTWK